MHSDVAFVQGLSEDVSIAKFFDDPMLVNIATDLQQFL